MRVIAMSDDNFQEYEEKMDRLNDGLLEAYAAGFAYAIEAYDIETGISTDVRDLKKHPALQENHYYYWDGRTKPLEFWLREQFNLDTGDSDE